MQALPSDVYPELSFPRIAVIAEVGDVSPERVLVTVTRILEEASAQVYRVRWIRSKTIRGASEVFCEFQPGTDMVFALHQLQARVAEAHSKLPPNVNLTIEPVTPAIFPVLSYNLSSKTLTQEDLYNITRYQIQPALTRAQGVARVQIQGGDIPQIAVEVDPARMRSYGVSLTQVSAALGKSNQIAVVGRLDNQYQQNLLVASDEALKAEDLLDKVVATPTPESPVRLKDIATVHPGHADRLSLVSVAGHPGIVLNVFRQPNANVVSVSDGVRKEFDKLRQTLPMGVTISPAYDESALVISAIANVRDAIGLGIILIIGILYFFLRSWRSTLIAAIAIPASALAAFGALYLTGQSLNLMSLGGMAVAIGLVIDDAIVVIENIDRQLKLNSDPNKAVTQALRELAGPVMTSTATTVVVFLPLGLLSGVAGQFFLSLTITLASAVIFSLILALTLTPMMCAQLLRPGDVHTHEKPDLLTQTYSKFLDQALRRPQAMLAAAALLLVIGTVLFSTLGSDFLPKLDEGSYVVDYLAPPGTSLSESNWLASKLESIIAKSPEVRTWTRRTGAELGLFATETNKGDILVVLKPSNQRSTHADDVMEKQRLLVQKELPQLDVNFHQLLQDQLNDLSGAPAPVEVRIFGEDPKVLHSLSDQVINKIEKIPGLVDVTSTSRGAAPQLDLQIDPIAAGRLGLMPSDLVTQVQASMLGLIPTQVRQFDRLVDVRVRLLDILRADPNITPNIPIIGTNGSSLPLSAVASIIFAPGEMQISRENQLRYVSVEGNLENRDLGSVVRDVEHSIADLKLPAGYSTQIAGLYATQQETFGQLILVLVLALMLVYLLLLIQFRSYLQPLAIFVALPLALFGVVIALWVTHTPLNVSSFMGIILLVGLVVKNGIILLDYANRLRREGVSTEQAVRNACAVRLRPILMTTLCTLLGLLPLALGLGAGAELQKPLSIAVIGGLSLSTVFTLIFVPFVYLSIEQSSFSVWQFFKFKPKQKATIFTPKER